MAMIAVAGVDMAAWDALARAAGVPLCVRNSDQREVTIQNVVDGKGNTSVEKDLLPGSP
jgi:L-alanine-DL-glutamate epimerase-like enolase superfamily enzyme